MSVSLPWLSRPNSNLVSAMRMPRLRACSAANPYSASAVSRTAAASSAPMSAATSSKLMFSSRAPMCALVAGVNSGCGRLPARQVIGHQVPGAREPEIGNAVQHPPLVGNRIGQHHVESRQPVGGHDEHRVVIECVDVAHLALVDAGKAAELGAVNDGGRHALVL